MRTLLGGTFPIELVCDGTILRVNISSHKQTKGRRLSGWNPVRWLLRNMVNYDFVCCHHICVKARIWSKGHRIAARITTAVKVHEKGDKGEAVKELCLFALFEWPSSVSHLH